MDDTVVSSEGLYYFANRLLCRFVNIYFFPTSTNGKILVQVSYPPDEETILNQRFHFVRKHYLRTATVDANLAFPVVQNYRFQEERCHVELIGFTMMVNSEQKTHFRLLCCLIHTRWKK